MHTETTVHTMPLETLRVRVAEARRLIAQAQEIARTSFDAPRDRESRDPGPQSERSGSDASLRVGQLLDAAQRLLPGMPPLMDERPPSSRMKRGDSGWRRVTLRAGAERALESLERAEILREVTAEAAALVAEIERRSASPFRAAEPVALEEHESRRI